MLSNKIDRKKLSEPVECICGRCGGEAWIMPFPSPQGICLCSLCSFGVNGLSLDEMLRRLFGRDEIVSSGSVE